MVPVSTSGANLWQASVQSKGEATGAPPLDALLLDAGAEPELGVAGRPGISTGSRVSAGPGVTIGVLVLVP